MRENFDYVVGSSPDAGICLQHKEIQPFHAVIRRRGDRLFLKPVKRGTECYINGRIVPYGGFQEFTRFDHLRLGRIPLEVGSGVFMGRRRLGLATQPLFFKGQGGRILCDGISINAPPGSVTAIMGPSGAGKSILLKLLAGIIKPNKGEIFLTTAEGNSIPKNALESNQIGFVPQGDAMFPELTTRTSLHFRLKILFPDMAKDVRERLIRQVVQQIGFNGKRRDAFLDTAIGSADSSGAVLSGGERRRANLCHELVSQPLVILLDEPTSGLSSSDAEDVMQLLRHLAEVEGLTIITTIHQPSEKAYSTLDNLILLTFGGKVAYQGPAAKAVQSISAKTVLSPTGRSSAEFILGNHEVLSKNPVIEGSGKDRAIIHPENAKGKNTGLAQFTVFFKFLWNWINQPLHLCHRQLLLMLKDHSSMIFALLQVPILFLLVYFTFQGSDAYYKDYDILTRTQKEYFEILSNEGGYAQGPVGRAMETAEADEYTLSGVHARHQAAFPYVLTLIAIWFGLMSSCCDIVTRKEIILREKRSGISLLHTILSLFTANAFLALMQAFAVAILAIHFLPEIRVISPAAVYRAVFLSTLTAVAIGLLISSTGRSARSALTLVPVCLIPQILIGGLFRRIEIPDSAYNILANLNPQRWAFDIALSSSPYANSGILVPKLGKLYEGNSWGLFTTLSELVQFEETGIHSIYFEKGENLIQMTPEVALLIIGFACLAGAYVFTRRR